MINEGLSKIVYHFTQIDNLVNILETNEFTLTSTLGSKSDYDVNKGRYFYLSTTRSGSAGYRSGNVKIVLDGDKLNQRYKGYAMDYWQYSKNPKDWGDSNSYKSMMNSQELEDRVISDKGTIPKAMSYIKEIHVFIETWFKYGKNIINKIIEITKRHNIPLYFYKNKKSYILGKTNDAINPNTIEFKDKDDVENKERTRRYYDEYRVAVLLSLNNDKIYKEILSQVDDNFKKKMDETYKNDYHKYLSPRAIDDEEGFRVYRNAIESIRRNSDKLSRYLLTTAVRDIKKMGLKTLKEYYNKKRWIGIKTIDDYKKEYNIKLKKIMLDAFAYNVKRGLNYPSEFNNNRYEHIYNIPEIRALFKTKLNEIYNRLVEVSNGLKGGDYIKYYSSQAASEDGVGKYKKLSDSDRHFFSGFHEDDREDIFEDVSRLFAYMLYDIDDSIYKDIKEIEKSYQSQF